MTAQTARMTFPQHRITIVSRNPGHDISQWLKSVLFILVAIFAAGAGLYFGLGMREGLRPVEVMQETIQPNSVLGIGEEFPISR